MEQQTIFGNAKLIDTIEKGGKVFVIGDDSFHKAVFDAAREGRLKSGDTIEVSTYGQPLATSRTLQAEVKEWITIGIVAYKDSTTIFGERDGEKIFHVFGSKKELLAQSTRDSLHGVIDCGGACGGHAAHDAVATILKWGGQGTMAILVLA